MLLSIKCLNCFVFVVVVVVVVVVVTKIICFWVSATGALGNPTDMKAKLKTVSK